MQGQYRKTLLILTTVGLALRLLFLVAEPSADLVGDEKAWTQWAEWISVPHTSFSPLGFRLVYRPPLYVYFIAVIIRLFESFTVVKVVQACLSATLVTAVGRIGARLYDARIGLWAAGATAAYPALVWYSVHLWSETLFVVLLMWSLERLFVAHDRGGAWTAMLSGFLWGLATLTRETALYFTPIVALWIWCSRERPRAHARALAYVFALLVTVSPWTLRNWILFHEFIPVSTASALNLWQGNVPLSWREVHDRYDSIPGRMNRDRYAQRMGVKAIIDRQPTWIFEKLWQQMPLFWELDSFPLRHIRQGIYGDVAPWIYGAAAGVVLAPYLALLVLFVIGVAATRYMRQHALLLAFLVYYNLLHVVAHGFSRYRLPVMPIVIIIAAEGWAAWRQGRVRRISARGNVALALVAAVLVLSVSLSVPRQWRRYRSFLDHHAPEDDEVAFPMDRDCEYRCASNSSSSLPSNS